MHSPSGAAHPGASCVYINTYMYNKILGVPILLSDKSTVDCHVLLLCSTCDLPARVLVMNMIQFNGFLAVVIACNKV